MVARVFLAWLSIPRDRRWLDIGCGTGALTTAVLSVGEPTSVKGIDPTVDFVSFARRDVLDKRAAFEQGNAVDLHGPDRYYDAVVSGLVLNFVPDPVEALAEMVRVTKDDGRVAAYVWDYADKMELIRYFWDAAIAIDPAAIELDEGKRFPLCNQQALESLFSGAGLRDVTSTPISVPTVFRDFDDYWKPFFGGQGPAPGFVSSLAEDRLMALREQIKGALPINADGSIALVARAWAVQGTR